MSSDVISLSQLESHLWESANILRGPVDAADFKSYVFPMLFFKRISDVHDEEYRAALEESGGDEEYACFPQNYRFQIPDGCHWRDVRVVTTNVGQALQVAMRGIEMANPDTLYGIFGDAQWTNKERLSDAMLRDLVEHFSGLELTLANLPEDELGQGYEYLIEKFADDSGHTAAEFYTNRTVVHLMTEMLQPQPGESIYDPTCGSGGMLLSCIAHLRRQGLEWRNVKLYGQERNLMTSSIARMNCFLHGIEDFAIARGDTLAEPKFVQGDRLMQFDVALANPPYSIKQWDREAFAADPWGRNLFGTPPQGRADYAFWQHIVCSLKPGSGRCAILFPHGVLFRQEEVEMRRKLIEADLIECVLGLGPNLFYNSPMEACVVICRTAKPRERRRKILFINAVGEVTRERAQSYLTDEHIARIIQAYERFADQPGFARAATLEEIRAQGGNLSIPLYVATASSAEIACSLPQALDAWLDSRRKVADVLRDLLPDMAISAADEALNGISDTALFDREGWRRVPFSEFALNVNERVEPSDAADEIYVGLEHLDPQDLHLHRWGKGSDVIGTKLRFRKGDIIFGRRRAYQRKLVVAEFDGICSAHAMVVRAKPDVVLPEFLPFLMMSDQFMSRAVGISVGSLSPTINWTTLKLEEFDLPLDQQRIAELLWAVDENLQEWRSVQKGIEQLRSTYAAESYGLGGGQSSGQAWGRLCDLVEVNPTLDARIDNDTEVSFVAMADVSEDGRIVNSQVKRYRDVRKGFTSFQEGDVLFAKITPCMENGKGALAAGLVNGLGFGSTEFHVLRPRRPEDADYIYHLTMTDQFRAAAKRYMRGSAGQQRVPADFLMDYPLVIAEGELRREIGAAITSMTRQIEELETLCQAVGSLNTALLGALFG